MSHSTRDNYSDEVINAYIDGELDHDEATRLIQHAQKDNELATRIHNLRQAKEAMKLAYDMTKPATKTASNSTRRIKSIAASIIMLAGVALGWIGHTYYTGNTLSPGVPMISQSVNQPWKIVMHVNSTDNYLLNTMLLETESLLESFKDNPEGVEVEIVAYGPGVLLFDENKSRYIKRLEILKNKYGNLNYAVCGRSMKKIEKEKGTHIKLLANTFVTRSGLAQIIKRQKQGWNYIRL